MEVSCQLHARVYLPPWRQASVPTGWAPRPGLDAVANIMSWLCWESNQYSSVIHCLAQSLYRLSFTGYKILESSAPVWIHKPTNRFTGEKSKCQRKKFELFLGLNLEAEQTPTNTTEQEKRICNLLWILTAVIVFQIVSHTGGIYGGWRSKPPNVRLQWVHKLMFNLTCKCWA
jgi:hypothetical protein